jgi:hypothetical protein
MRQFFLMFSDGSGVPEALGGPLFPQNLGWTHYAILMRVANPTARSF